MEFVLLDLVEANKIDMKRTNDRTYILDIIYKNSTILDDPDLSHIVEIHHDFISAANAAMERKKPIIAIVLLSAAVEQILNLHYRNHLGYQGIPEEDITQLIKRSNFETKTGWLMSLVFGSRLSEDLRKRVLKLAEVRNSIIHYKAVPGRFRSNEGSFGCIEDQIECLDKFSILKIPDELDEELNKMREENDHRYKAVREMIHTIGIIKEK